MAYTFSKITTSTASNELLQLALRSNANPVACASFGSAHCDSPDRTNLKIKLWGGRGDNSSELECKNAHFIIDDSDGRFVGFINLGVTGNPPTVKDHSGEAEGQVYESSALFLADAYRNKLEEVSQALIKHYQSCYVEPEYTKLIAPTSPNNAVNQAFWENAGAVKLTGDNVEELLGANSLHPARFGFDKDGNSVKCTSWDQKQEEVEYEGFHAANPCDNWVPQDIFVLNISGDHLLPDHSDL